MYNLSKVADTLAEIASVRGTNAKKIILKRALNDSTIGDDLEKVLKHLFDPMISTGISKTSWKKAQCREYMGLSDISSILEYLHKNNSGKLETVETMKSVYDCMPTANAKMLIYYLTTKDINIGISRGTVEKFIEIPKFEIMLGSHIEYDDIDWDRDFILTQKLDGVNLTVFKDGDKIKMFTRQGRQIEGLKQLEEAYKKMPDGVYCGEAMYSGECANRGEFYRMTTGEITSKRTHKQIKHYVFDYTTLKEWKDGIFVKAYFQTLSYLLSLDLSEFIEIVPIVYRGNSREDAMRLLDEAKARDEEGLMLRYTSSTYEKTRSKNLIKLKPMFTMDLRITGYKEYKHPGMLGAFVVKYKGNEVSVGGGYSLENRKKFWEIRDKMIGKIIEVQYMEETQSKDGSYSLRFPNYVRIREDKDNESYN